MLDLSTPTDLAKCSEPLTPPISPDFLSLSAGWCLVRKISLVPLSIDLTRRQDTGNLYIGVFRGSSRLSQSRCVSWT